MKGIIILRNILIVVVFGATINSCANHTQTSVNFLDRTEYPIDTPVSNSESWVSESQGEPFLIKDNGLVFPVEQGSLIKYARPIEVTNIGDVVSMTVDFTYDQVEGRKIGELFRVGFSAGESKLMAIVSWDWGSNLAFECEGRSVGDVMHTIDFGFPNDKALGTSQKLAFSVSLTKKGDNLFDMAMYLKNLENDSVYPRYWVEKEVRFDSGNTSELNVVIQNGTGQLPPGIANKTISKLTISNTKLPIPEKDWSGVDFVSYFKPIEPQSALVRDGVWGAANVLPRDTANGLEGKSIFEPETGKYLVKDWCYWDGRIVKDDEGKYHMYASRWPQSVNHHIGWTEESKGIHAISDNPLGPYKDLGLIYPQWKEGKGSNVVGVRTHEGKYAVVTSEITKGEIFLADNPYGPFELLGEIKVDYNGFSPGIVAYRGGKGNMSNVMIIPMPDGKSYMLVPRYTSVMISEEGIQGPYKVVSGPVFKTRPELHVHHNEDPTVWYSGGRYYIMYNHWPSKTCHLFSSEDGIHDWTYRGIAFKKGESKIFKYTDGTVNMWEFVERPTAYVENGHVTHFIFSVLDVHKGQDNGNDNHGSKIVVVPFDGEAFDRDMQKVVDQKNALKN